MADPSSMVIWIKLVFILYADIDFFMVTLVCKKFLVFSLPGGLSIGCPENGGAAGTYYDATLLSLRVGNDNISTETETPLLDFSTTPLWSKVYIENSAKALVPLLWTRVQVSPLSTS